MTRLFIACLAFVLTAASADACHSRSIFRGRTVTRTVVVQAVQPAAPKPPVVAPAAAAACQTVEVTKVRSGRIADILGRLRPRSSARSGC